MTKTEAIAMLKRIQEPEAWESQITQAAYEALDMAIKALERQSEDAISRKAVVKYIKASDAELGHDSENEIVVEDILNMPPVTPVACIATVKFSKEDIQEFLLSEGLKEVAT